MPTTPNPATVSDFSNLPPLAGSSPFGSAYVLVGDRYEQAPALTSIYYIDNNEVPQTFPMQQWYDQSGRYVAYWAWFNGDVLAQAKQGEDGEILFRFPLRVNVLRDIVRKNTSLLFGEVEDGPNPLVTTHVQPKGKLNNSVPTETEYKVAAICENIVNQVWTQSDGRSIQQEAGELCQFLGGHVFKVSYEAWHTEVDIPIFIRSWKADLFLPVWKQNDYWELEEAYVVSRIEAAQAKNDYGVETNGAFVYYIEHWTKKNYSFYINGKAITRVVNGESITFKDLVNPFGFVPFIYIPHLREGSFYGTSHVPDLVGLIEEYNSAMANLGDAIQDSIKRERFIRNAPRRNKVTLPSGVIATDLGSESPGTTNPPDAFVEDPPTLSQGLANYPSEVYKQIRRTASMPPVADGEDEGSQRSGVTLDVRFWPATAHAKVERGYWETGLNHIAKMILKMCIEKNLFSGVDPETKIFESQINKLAFSQNWSPQLPRDRAAEVTEYLARLQQGGMSIKMFLRLIGDVDNIEQEEKDIKEWKQWLASVEQPQDQFGQQNSSPTQSYKEKA